MASDLTNLILSARNKDQVDGEIPLIGKTALKNTDDGKLTRKSLGPSADGEDVLGPMPVLPLKVVKTSRNDKKIIRKSNKTRPGATKSSKSTTAGTPRQSVTGRKQVTSTKASVGLAKNTDGKMNKSFASKNGKAATTKATKTSQNDNMVAVTSVKKQSVAKSPKKQAASAKAVVEPKVRNAADDGNVRRRTVTKTVGKISAENKGKGRQTGSKNKALGAAKNAVLVHDEKVQDAAKKLTTTMTPKRTLLKLVRKPISKTDKPHRADDANAVVAIGPTATVNKSVLLYTVQGVSGDLRGRQGLVLSFTEGG